MRKNIVMTALFALFMSLSAQDIYAVSWQSDLESALDRAGSSGDPVMVDFYTDWCGWCKKMDADTYSDSRVNELSRDFICVQVDAERDKASASKYSVRGYPTVIFLNSAGKTIQVVSGYRGPKDFAAIMESVLKKPKSKMPKNADKDAKSAAGKTAGEPQGAAAAKKLGGKEAIKEAVHNMQKRLNKAKNENMELSGIIYDKVNPRAVINNNIVKVGDIVEGAKVVKIEKSYVELSLHNKVIKLKME